MGDIPEAMPMYSTCSEYRCECHDELIEARKILIEAGFFQCAICSTPTKDPVDAIDDHKPVKVCRDCYEYETGEKAGE